MSKWIVIDAEGYSDTGKTRVWSVKNTRTQAEVGKIRWYGGWRKYAFYVNVEDMAWVSLDSECMRNIADYLDEVNAKRRRKL